MGSELAPILFILLAGISVYWSVSVLFAQNADAKALSWASGNAPEKSKSQIIEVSRTLVHQFTLRYALKVKNPRYRKKVEAKILTSGLSNELNVDEFIGLQLLWGALFPIVLLILNFALSLQLPVVLIIAVVAPGGALLPHFHANAQRKVREVSVLADLPFFIDLLALSTEAGLDFQGAIQRIVEKARGSGSVLAEELETVLRDISLGSSRADALRGMGRRLDINEISSFVNVVVDADATGASIGRVLKDQSEQIRVERFVRAEKAGARASQAILIPLMLFILPAVFIMVFAPVALQFMYGNK
jgi:tight adherence protein C